MKYKLAAILLAGGLSRRMGGGDKNLIFLGGRPLLLHVLDRIDLAKIPTMINANGDPARYEGFGLPVCADVIDGHVGPLAGILTGFDWVRESYPECTHMVSLATDAPFLPHDLISRLAAGLDGGADIVQAMSSDRRHPVFAIWSIELANDLRKSVCVEGVRKIDDFTNRHNCVTVAFSGNPDPFMNLNRPEDFERARVLFGV
jgi:molybdopterin-guanine dinucleotide biosynthesis protein A